MNPESVIFAYSLVAPMLLSVAAFLWFMESKPQVVINFPRVLLCGKTDRLGTSIDIQGNGMLGVHGTTLPPNKYVMIIEVNDA